MEFIIGKVAAEPIGRFSTDNYATFPWHTEPYWNNDSFVSDGFFDIPTPQISTWPDKFYHSSMDTVDQMSDNTLGRVGAIVGMYLYMLASADREMALWFASLAAKDWKQRICTTLTEEALENRDGSLDTRSEQLHSLGVHLGLQGADAVKQVIRFAPDDDSLLKTLGRISNDMQDFAIRESQGMIALVSDLDRKLAAPEDREQNVEIDGRRDVIVKRLRWRTPSDSEFSDKGRAKLVALRERGSNVVKAWDWLNGRRTIEEVWKCMQHRNAVPYDTVADYLELLMAEGMAVRLHRD